MIQLTEIYKLEDIVKYILEIKPSTRNSDMMLYFEYGKLKLNTNVQNDFYKLFLDADFRKEHNIMCFESVSRCRRKLQAMYPELKACSDVLEKREELEKAYIEYAIGG